MTEREMAEMRFVSTGEGATVTFISPCAKCVYVYGAGCKKLTGDRPWDIIDGTRKCEYYQKSPTWTPPPAYVG